MPGIFGRLYPAPQMPGWEQVPPAPALPSRLRRAGTWIVAVLATVGQTPGIWIGAQGRPRPPLILAGAEIAQAFKRAGTDQVVVLEGADRLLAGKSRSRAGSCASHPSRGHTVTTAVRMTAARQVGSERLVMAFLADGRGIGDGRPW